MQESGCFLWRNFICSTQFNYTDCSQNFYSPFSFVRELSTSTHSAVNRSNLRLRKDRDFFCGPMDRFEDTRRGNDDQTLTFQGIPRCLAFLAHTILRRGVRTARACCNDGPTTDSTPRCTAGMSWSRGGLEPFCRGTQQDQGTFPREGEKGGDISDMELQEETEKKKKKKPSPR